jgi:hypothetical protein
MGKKAPYGTWSSGRPRGRTDYVTATLVDRQQAEQSVIAMVLEYGFVSAGMTDPRTVIKDDGVTTVQLTGRKRYENRDRVRVTIGRDTTFFYTVGDNGEPNMIASHKTLEIDAIKRTLMGLAA